MEREGGGSGYGGGRRLAETLAGVALIQAAFMAVSWAFRTEFLFDASAAVTYAFAFWYSWARGRRGAKRTILTAFATAWAARLGGFLLWRVVRTGGDARFDAYTGGSLAAFAVPWALQIAWISLVGMPVYLANLSAGDGGAAAACTDAAGYLIAAAGLAAETAADAQKWAAGRGAFPRMGLFDAVLYPQYGGEIAVWTGVTIAALSLLPSGAERAAAFVSPAATYAILRFVSGVPIAERRRLAAFGDEYARHARTRPLFFP